MLCYPAFALVIVYAEEAGVGIRRALILAVVLTLAVGTWLAVAINSLQTEVQGLPGAVPVVALVLLALATLSRNRWVIVTEPAAA
jgi:hypothetical protein